MFCSDSQAAIKALSNCYTTSGLVESTRDSLNRLACRVEVTLMWTPGHVGIDGNERADRLAKHGCSRSNYAPEPVLPVSYALCRTAVTRWLRRKALQDWRDTPGCRLSKVAFPAPDRRAARHLVSLTRRRLRAVISVLSGHGEFAAHQFVCGKRTSPVCEHCEEEKEDSYHFLWRCQAFESHRQRLAEATGSRAVNSLPALTEVIKFVESTERMYVADA